MAPTTRADNRGGTAHVSALSSLLLVAAYSLAAILMLQGVTSTAAAKMKTANTMDDTADMVEDFAREVMKDSIIDM